MPTDRTFLKQAQAAQIGSMPLAAAANNTIAEAHSILATAHFHDSGVATVPTTESVVARFAVAGILKTVYVSCPIAVTAHASNNATFTVGIKTGTSTTVTVGTAATTSGGTGSLSANVPVAISLNTNTTITAGDVLTFAVAKNASGVALCTATATATNFGTVCAVVEEV